MPLLLLPAPGGGILGSPSTGGPSSRAGSGGSAGWRRPLPRGCGSSGAPVRPAERHPSPFLLLFLLVQDSPSGPLPTFLVAGGSLAFGTLLCIGVVLRFRKTWRLRALKDDKASGRPPHSLGQLVPERPKPTPGLVPLISPPVSPSSPGSDSASRHCRPDARRPQSPYDVSNRDYFFPG